jgi:hypothetical protein
MLLTFSSRASRLLALLLLAGVAACAVSKDDLVIVPSDGAADKPSAASDARSYGDVADGSRAGAETPSPAPTSDGAAAVQGPAQCQRDEDCQLVNDCCSCQAIGGSEPVPICDPRNNCVMPSCSQYGGLDRARCMAGRCVLGFDCDTTNVTCKKLPPVCPPGETPRVVGDGAARCYGECVDARQCLSVPTCAVCAPKDLCVRYSPSTQPLHCVPIPAGCANNTSCGCVAPAICVGAYHSCQGGSLLSTIMCGCPNCM